MIDSESEKQSRLSRLVYFKGISVRFFSLKIVYFYIVPFNNIYVVQLHVSVLHMINLSV